MARAEATGVNSLHSGLTHLARRLLLAAGLSPARSPGGGEFSSAVIAALTASQAASSALLLGARGWICARRKVCEVRSCLRRGSD